MLFAFRTPIPRHLDAAAVSLHRGQTSYLPCTDISIKPRILSRCASLVALLNCDGAFNKLDGGCEIALLPAALCDHLGWVLYRLYGPL